MKYIAQPSSSLTDKLIIIGVGAAAIWYLGFKVKDSNKNTSQSQIDNSPEANQADSLYRLIHPYGGGLLSVVENVDEKAIIEWAKGVKNVDKVAQFYRQMTGNKSLWDEVAFVLDEEEYAEFKKNLNLKTSTPPSPVRKVIASPTTSNGLVTIFEDPYFKKPLESFKANTVLGTTLKSVKYFSKNYNKEMRLYFIRLTHGKHKGKSVYVLQSQVKLK